MDEQKISEEIDNSNGSSYQKSMQMSDNDKSMIRIQASFTEKLKHENCLDIKEKMLNCIRDIQQGKYQDKEVPDIVRNLITTTEEQFQKIWNEPQDIAKENGEAVEAIITKALYAKLIQLYQEKFDKKIEFSLKVYDFIELKHFEIDESLIQHTNFEKAKHYLNTINDYKTPRDKLVSICNCCKLVSSMVASKQTKPIGADIFLPVLIYVVLQAKPTKANSNLEFIRDYRSPTRLKGEDEYYFTSYESALGFIENIDGSIIKIQPQEFIQQYNKKCIQYQDLMKNLEDNDQLEQPISVQICMEKLYKIKNKLYEFSDSFSSIEKKQKLKFENTPYAELTVEQLPQFFSEYHVLSKHYNDMQQKLTQLLEQTEQITKVQDQQKKSKFLGLF